MAASAGIQVNVVVGPASEYWDNVWLKHPFQVSGWSARPPGEALAIAYRSNAPYPETHWKNKAYDALLDRANTTVPTMWGAVFGPLGVGLGALFGFRRLTRASALLSAGYAAAMADIGHEVLGVDVDPGKVEALTRGIPPFFEPGFPELLNRALASGRLQFTTSLAEAARFGDIHFLCVGTPQQSGLTPLISATSTLQCRASPRTWTTPAC
jgi:hypothetical protein